MTQTLAIEARQVTRYYGISRGVRDLDLAVPTGAILGLPGENGSGKTTALRLAMGALLPDRGAVTTLLVLHAYHRWKTRQVGEVA